MKKSKKNLKTWIAEQNETLDVETIKIPLRGLPLELERFRIAVVSDLHFRVPEPTFHGKIIQAIDVARPECIVVAGDTIDSTTQYMGLMDSFFRGLTQIAPTVAILGNNDCLRGFIYGLRDVYRRTGVTLLENEMRMLPARMHAIRMIGMMDPHAKKKGIEPERKGPQNAYQHLDEVVPQPGSKAPAQEGQVDISILLVHRPELAKQYADSLAPSLIISGHAHGGQIRLKNGQGIFSPGQGFLPKLTSGRYQVGNSWLVVSRGLGNHEFPLRVNNHPHLPIIELYREEE